MKEGELIPVYIVDLRKVLAKEYSYEFTDFKLKEWQGGGPTHMWKYIC